MKNYNYAYNPENEEKVKKTKETDISEIVNKINALTREELENMSIDDMLKL